MSDIIQLLPDHVANQIAAGEVVQRPASVVKELLENAIDAKATHIKLVVKDAGKQLIQVIDNGMGMSVTDARMAFERHATSKIKSTDDIFQIMTKGFRGEALASIAAVSQVELKSKQDHAQVGTEILIEGGKVTAQNPCTCPTGTSIAVKNLFYNVPARRNFLKSSAVEFRHILDELHRVALAHENIQFQLFHNDQEILRLNATHAAQRILHIFGKKLEGNLVPVAEETEIVKLKGFIGKPEVAKKTRGEQFFFVNNRFIRSNYLHKALLDAFENLIPKGHHPSYFLHLEIKPEKIDINIHPTKTEIKFEDEYAIYAVLRSAVKHALGQYQVAPSLDFNQPDWEIPAPPKNQKLQYPKINIDRSYNPFDVAPPSAPKDIPTQNFEVAIAPETATVPSALFDTEKKAIRTLAQWNKSYLIALYESDVLLIDQYRAHQKILFEHFMQQSSGNTLSQQLLFPLEVPVNMQEQTFLQETETQWLAFGFDFHLSEGYMIVNALPAELKPENALQAITAFLSDFEQYDPQRLKEEMAKSMAKSAAIRKDREIQLEEAQHLAQQLFLLDQPNYTPFGKKIFKKITLEELVKFLDT